MQPDYDLIVHGICFADLIYGQVPHLPAPGEEVHCGAFGFSGGGAFITAVAAARLDLKVAILSPFGQGPLEQVVKGLLESEGVDTQWAYQSPDPLPFVTVAINHGGDRGFLTYESSQHHAAFQAHCLRVVNKVSASWLHLGAHPHTLPLVELALKKNIQVSMGTAWDPEWLQDPDLIHLIACSHLFLANRQEAEAITRTHSLRAAGQALEALAPRFAITNADQGGLYRELASPPRPFASDPTPVVDSTGAGDNFTAGVLAGLINGATFRQAVDLGSYCGRQSVRGFGGTSTAARLADANHYLEPAGWALRPFTHRLHAID